MIGARRGIARHLGLELAVGLADDEDVRAP